jgi:hypothetical protein
MPEDRAILLRPLTARPKAGVVGEVVEFVLQTVDLDLKPKVSLIANAVELMPQRMTEISQDTNIADGFTGPVDRCG